MPKLTQSGTMSNINTASNYGFSAVKLDQLGATEYSLATIVVDRSSSLYGFDRDLEKMLSAAVESCQKSPRAENMMVRVVSFNQNETEIHGFKLLESIDPADYDGVINTSGTTLLFDTTYRAIEASRDYGEMLVNQDYMANAIVFVVTDGMDNKSKFAPSQIATLVEQVRKAEVLDSIAVVLVGMTSDPSVQVYLDEFKNEAKLDEYIEMGDVTPAKLAKLAGYISKSTSSTSQALGTGGPSQSLSLV